MNYFYAMEFVQGETLESLIKRSGRLEIKLALEIVIQVAAGLGAINKENLVHRDIKPSNIMVSLMADGVASVKIIDLGLAKMLTDQNLRQRFRFPELLRERRNSPVPNNLLEAKPISVPICTH